ncbi:MAG: alpha/beta hydrolase [Nocardioides sp.]
MTTTRPSTPSSSDSAGGRPGRGSTRAQRARRAAIVVVAAVLGGHLVAGWYYSNRIYTDALDAGVPFEWPRDLLVNGVDTEETGDAKPSGTITLIDADAEQANQDQVRGRGTYGLVYDGGFGLITGEPVINGSRVTRRFEVTQGEPPRLGQRAGINSFAYPREPMAPMEEVTYDGPLGQLSGILQPGTGEVWAILVHGRASGPDETFRLMRATGELGMPSLAIRYRNDPGVPRSENDEYGFGASEWPDLQAAIDYATSRGATGVVLTGGSMGGGIVAAYLENAEDTSLVRGIVLDSPMLDLDATVSYGAEQIEVQGRNPVPATVTWTAKRLASLRFGLDWDSLDYLDSTAWASVPTLLFHGDEDLLVPVTSSRRLAEQDPDVTYVEIPGTGHVEGWNTDPTAYELRVRRFLEPLIRPARG